MIKSLRLGCGAVLALVAMLVSAQAAKPEKPIAPPSGVFEFVGFSSGMVDGGVGIFAINAACQADFGPDARMCTSEEFWRSPGATSPGPTSA